MSPLNTLADFLGHTVCLIPLRWDAIAILGVIFVLAGAQVWQDIRHVDPALSKWAAGTIWTAIVIAAATILFLP